MKKDMQFTYKTTHSFIDSDTGFYISGVRFFLDDFYELLDPTFRKEDIVKYDGLFFKLNEAGKIIYVFMYDNSDEIILYDEEKEYECNLEVIEIYYNSLKNTSNPKLVSLLQELMGLCLKITIEKKEKEIEKIKQDKIKLNLYLDTIKETKRN